MNIHNTIIYFSGSLGEERLKILEQLGIKFDRLRSFYEVRKNFHFEKSPAINRFFLDSGAFSAFSKGEQINIDKYIEYIYRYKDKITAYANLDDKSSAEITLQNQRYIEQAGLTPVPVYHFGEEKKYLDYYINNYGYLALGGIAGADTSSDTLYNWCSRIKKIKDIKIHLFGITDFVALKKLSIYSCDSTSWLAGGRFGTIYLDGKLVHKNKLSKQMYEGWKELNDFLKMVDISIIDFLDDKNYRYRDVFNLIQTQKFHKDSKVIKEEQQELFSWQRK